MVVMMMESGLGKSEKTNGAGEERWRREMKEKRAREEDKGWKEGGGEGRDEGGGGRRGGGRGGGGREGGRGGDVM